MSEAKPAYGTIEVDEFGIAIVTFERFFSHPKREVWNAITDPDSRLGFFSSADMRLAGKVSIRFSDDLVESATITKLVAPVLLEYVNVQTNGHPAKYYTDRLEIRDAAGGCLVTFSTPLGPMGALQLRIVAGWHVWIDNWQTQLDDPDVSRMELNVTQPQREKQLLGGYQERLMAKYPGWKPD